MRFFNRRHLRRIEDIKSFPALVADPEFLFIRRQRRAVRPPIEISVTRHHPMQHLASFDIRDIEADMFSETDESEFAGAVDGKGKNTAFANRSDTSNDRIVAGANDSQHGLGAAENQ